MLFCAFTSAFAFQSAMLTPCVRRAGKTPSEGASQNINFRTKCFISLRAASKDTVSVDPQDVLKLVDAGMMESDAIQV